MRILPVEDDRVPAAAVARAQWTRAPRTGDSAIDGLPPRPGGLAGMGAAVEGGCASRASVGSGAVVPPGTLAAGPP